jgi:hypothetical protein
MINDINGEHSILIIVKILARFTLPVTPANKIRPIARVQTVREAIGTIANPEDVEVDGHSLEGSAFAPMRSLTTIFSRLTRFSHFQSRSDMSIGPRQLLIRRICPGLPHRPWLAVTMLIFRYYMVRFRPLRRPTRGLRRPSTRDAHTLRGSTFAGHVCGKDMRWLRGHRDDLTQSVVWGIEALIRLSPPSTVAIVGNSLAPKKSPAQIGSQHPAKRFVAGGT